MMKWLSLGVLAVGVGTVASLSLLPAHLTPADAPAA